MLSCGVFNAANMFGSVGQVGNTAMFDDVNLTEVSGLPLQFIPSMDVKLSPNPVSQILNVELEKYVDNGYFEIFDAQAKLIRKFPISGTSGHFSVSDLSGGVYHYKLTEGTTFLNSGTFIVTK
jgi:hypothetical protein